MIKNVDQRNQKNSKLKFAQKKGSIVPHNILGCGFQGIQGGAESWNRIIDSYCQSKKLLK